MTKQEKHEHYVKLHDALDQLLAEYIAEHHYNGQSHYLDMPIRKLIDYSHKKVLRS